MKTIEEIAQYVIDNRYPKSENDKVSDFEMYQTLIEAMNKVLRQPLVSGNEVALPFDKVTRLEVISYREGDKSGRVFTHWKDDNKIEGQLQDKDRTLKIFIDKR